MWNIRIMNFDFFFIVYSFFIFSFAGWIYETTKCSIEDKSFVNRGFLNGPIIPIYGVGGTIVYVVLKPFELHVGLVLLLGFILTTVLEYLTAVAMEKAFHAKWWDYSRFKYNFQGRICLPASLLWAVFSAADVYVLGPMVERIVDGIPRKAGELMGYVLIVIFLSDFLITVVYTLQLSLNLKRLSTLREELLTYLLNTSLIEKTTELKETLQSASISHLSEKREAVVSLLLERFKASLSKEMNDEDLEQRVVVFKKELETKLKNFSTKYRMDSKRNNFIHKRLLKAFPTLTFTKGRYYLQEIKERINSYNGKK